MLKKLVSEPGCDGGGLMLSRFVQCRKSSVLNTAREHKK